MAQAKPNNNALGGYLKISPERALDLYYSTTIYEQMTDRNMVCNL